MKTSSVSISDSSYEKLAGRNAIRLTPEDLERFGELLLKRCGLHFPESRRIELEHGIRQTFAASTCSTLDEFYNLVEDPQAGAMEMDLLINAVTVSETHFFRDQGQFNAIIEHVLPQIIQRKRNLRTLRFWSAGCASGEEPYSLAMLLRNLLPDVDQWSITILATDINTASLERARQGVYGNWAFREERAKEMRQRYFVPTTNNRYALAPEVKRMVLFSKLNLVEPCFPSYETNTMLMDLIICRNVTIYFSEPVTRWVVDRFYDALVGGGWLIVGHSEPSLDIYRKFRARNFPDTVLYQRMSDTAALRALGSRRLLPSQMPIPLPPIAAPMPNPIQAPALSNPEPETFALIPALPEPIKESNPLDHARDLLEFGHSEQACSILTELAENKPGDTTVDALLGQAYANLGNWSEAERWCLRAIAADRLNLDAYYTLSLVMQHEGNLKQAIDCMKKVVYIDSTNILGHYGLATLFYESNLLPQAQKSLENAQRLLQGKAEDTFIPGSKGITVGRLRAAITSQQQAWSM